VVCGTERVTYRALIAALPDPRPVVLGAGDPLCYVIYTSGSTGWPKGVAVSQSSVSTFLEVVAPVYEVEAGDRVHQGMTVAFDFSIEEIWPAWGAGATVVAGPTDTRRLGPGSSSAATGSSSARSRR
jgi:non-ribosomal peptide synthetase component F